MLARDNPEMEQFAIFAQNLLLIAGTVFIYIGIRRFFNKGLNLRFLISSYAVFSGLMFFLVFIRNDMTIRSVVLNFALSFIAIITGVTLFRDRWKSVSVTATFLGITFILHGLFFFYRFMVYIASPPPELFFSNDLYTLLPFLDALLVSLFWTYGFIIMVSKRLFADLKEQHEQLKTIFTTSPDAAIITRLDNGQIIDYNEGYKHITGYSDEDLIGKSTIGLNIWHDPQDRAEVIRLMKEQGFCENFEASFHKKDGSVITGLMSAKLLFLQETPHIISITRDITGRKRTEQDLVRLNQDLIRLNGEKDKFFSILAHDLRGPFNYFLGFTQLMAEEIEKLSLREVQRIAISMRRSAISLYNLLENLLEWSRLERGLSGFAPESFSLLDNLRETLLSGNEVAQRKAIEIKVDIPAGLEVKADPRMIQTVIRNLLSNAIKYSPRGKSIELIAGINDGMLTLTVRDSGIGMSDEMISTLFSQGNKNNRPGTEGETSTGLGLIICKEFVEIHRGTIYAESSPGSGSSFHVKIPQSG